MTPKPDRRERIIRGRTTAEVEQLIGLRVFSKKDRQIFRDLFVDGLTYEETAERAEMSPRGLYYRVKRVEKYLN